MKRLFYIILACAFLAPPVLASEPDSMATEVLQEVVVSGQGARRRMAELHLGVEQLELGRLAKMPMLMGENDLIKAITLMPGVHAEGDGAGGFEVRGGTSAQNLVLLDGITLYDPAHVMGIFSTFNDDAISRATLYKGPIPAAYGGATASVLDVALDHGGAESYHASATVGLLLAKVMASGPIVKKHLSMAVTARRSYADVFLAMVPKFRGTVMNFYDVTAKVRWMPAGNHSVDASFYVGHDNMAVKDVMGMYWGNIGGSIRWTAHRGDALTATTTAALTHYSPDMRTTMGSADSRLREYIHSYSLNSKLDFALAEGHAIEAGLRSELLRVKSAEMDVNSRRELDVRSGWQNALWIDYEGSFGRLSLSAGLRLELFSAMSGSRFHEFAAAGETTPDFSARTYVDAAPRLGIKYELNKQHNIKLGAGLSTQNLHALRSSTTSFPFDRYALTSATVKPERTLQAGIGYAGMSSGADYDWSAEFYCKHMRNVYDYEDGRTMYSRVNIESIIKGGRGRSAGLELMLRKNTGRLTGWLSYTLSATQTRIEGINGGRWYDASNDRRHDVSLTATYHINDRWDVSGLWVYTSGRPLTAPDAKYELDGEVCYYYSARNSYRTPATHRLDLSAIYTRVGRRFTSQVSFGLYNTYCRYNPFIIYFEDDPSHPSGTRAVQRSLFGLLPFVSYTIKY
ncbi:MAG: TonB-dependent receptor plug domain-containing protein [Muribaculaceae bacterium]|nr:TonB-dependent receptor plug domain-containing protein [Muribaculaceae bacterium]